MPSCAQRQHTNHFGMVGHEINNLSRSAFHKYVCIIATTTQKNITSRTHEKRTYLRKYSPNDLCIQAR